jgi:hypothetical protein
VTYKKECRLWKIKGDMLLNAYGLAVIGHQHEKENEVYRFNRQKN